MSTEIKTLDERIDASEKMTITVADQLAMSQKEAEELRAALAGCQQTISEYADLLRAARMAVELAATQAPSAPVAPETPVAALMYMDELPAAQAGEKWIAQFAKEADKVMYSPDEGNQAIRVKWCAYFDSYDRLVAAYLLTRDAKNWTQLSRVRGEPFAPRAALSMKAAQVIQPSLLRDPTSASNPLPPGCFCKPGRCAAPVVMGRQTPCRDTAKRDAAAPTPPTTGEA